MAVVPKDDFAPDPVLPWGVAVVGGASVGVAGFGVVTLFDLARVGSPDGSRAAVELALQLLALAAAWGAVVGASLGLLAAVIERATRRHELARVVGFASLLSAPFSGLWIALLADRWAALSTLARTTMVVGLIVMQLAVFLVVRVGTALMGIIRTESSSRPKATVMAVLLAGSAVLFWADAVVLPRLYPRLHDAFVVGAVLGAVLACLVVGVAGGSTALRLGRVGASAVLAVAGVSLLPDFGDDPVVASAVLRQTSLASRLVRVTRSAFDVDRDGYSSVLGGGDCDDDDDRINPVALDIPENDVDEDCSGGDLRLEDLLASPPETAPHPAADLDVLFVTLDALRADHVGAYGYHRPTTPNLDALAKEAVVFERAYAQSSGTAASLPSLMTGRYPSSSPWAYGHPKRVDPAWPFLTDAENLTLAEIMRAAGYATEAAVHGNLILGIGLRQGFTSTRDGYVDILADFEGFLRRHEGGRWFFWMHHADPHHPYLAHDGHDFGSAPLDLYDGEIAHADARIGDVFDAIKVAGTWDRTLVIVTSDHGEEFGEHGGSQHASSLYEEQIRVPLLLRIPGVSPARVSHPAENVDILPTLISVLGLPRPQRLDGQSLLGLLDDPPRTTPVAYSEQYLGHVFRKALVVDRWKIIVRPSDNSVELYDLEADPAERSNLASSRPVVLRRMQALLGAAASRRELLMIAEASRGSGPAVLRLARQLVAIDRLELVAAAIDVLGATRDQRVQGHLSEAARRDLPEDLRIAIIGAMEKIGGHGAFHPLLRLADDDDDDVRRAADAALGRLVAREPMLHVPPGRDGPAPDVAYLDFGTKAGQAHVLRGIGPPHLSGVRSVAWSRGKETRVVFWIDGAVQPGGYRLELAGRGHARLDGSAVTVKIEGRAPLGAVTFPKRFARAGIDIPSTALRSGANYLTLTYSTTVGVEGQAVAVRWDFASLTARRRRGVHIPFGAAPSHVQFGDGWGKTELARGKRFRWTRGARSVVRVALEPERSEYELRAHTARAKRPVVVRVNVNGARVGVLEPKQKWERTTLPVPAGVLVAGENEIAFDHESPDEEGEDERPPRVRWRALALVPDKR